MLAQEGSQVKIKVNKINPLSVMTICTTFHSNPSNSCWNIQSGPLWGIDWLTLPGSVVNKRHSSFTSSFFFSFVNGTAQNVFLSFPLQGLMFGYATDETEECMPLSILLAHKLTHRLKELSCSGECPWILPDSKSQVSHLSRKTRVGLKV